MLMADSNATANVMISKEARYLGVYILEKVKIRLTVPHTDYRKRRDGSHKLLNSAPADNQEL